MFFGAFKGVIGKKEVGIRGEVRVMMT